MTTPPATRITVCTGGLGSEWHLPSSTVDRRPYIGGGERSLYELAFALAAEGHLVELRGNISEPVLGELASVLGPGPVVSLADRRPQPDEIVVHVEGARQPIQFGALALSPARTVIALFAPPGLFGWSFTNAAAAPDPTAVSPADVGRPEHYQAMAALGFTLWSNSAHTAGAAAAAGVDCAFIGSGNPVPPPDDTVRDHDIVVVGGNRWADAAGAVADAIGATCLITVPGSNADLLRQLGRGRVLVHPMRVEGTSRLGHEARRMGTILAALTTNPYLAGASRDEGAILAPDADRLAAAVRTALDDPAELQRLSDGGRQFAERWNDWPAYRSRVAAAVATVAAPPAHKGAMAAIGAEIEEKMLGLTTQRDLAIAAGDAANAELDAIRGTRTWMLRDRVLLPAHTALGRLRMRGDRSTRRTR